MAEPGHLAHQLGSGAGNRLPNDARDLFDVHPVWTRGQDQDGLVTRQEHERLDDSPEAGADG